MLSWCTEIKREQEVVVTFSATAACTSYLHLPCAHLQSSIRHRRIATQSWRFVGRELTQHYIHTPRQHSTQSNTTPYMMKYLHPNNPTRGPAPRIPRLLALSVSTLPQVVGTGVHDDGAAQHALRADELDVLVGHGALGVALRVGLEVAEVADVAFGVRRGAVFFAVGVDWEENQCPLRPHGVVLNRDGGLAQVV